jgi:hypothetical protein
LSLSSENPVSKFACKCNLYRYNVLRASRRMHRRKAQKEKYMQKLRHGFDMSTLSSEDTAKRAAMLRRNAHSEPDRDPSRGGRGTWGGKSLDVTGGAPRVIDLSLVCGWLYSLTDAMCCVCRPGGIG